MKIKITLVLFTLASLSGIAAAQPRSGINNPRIDYDKFIELAVQAGKHRASRRLTEDKFISMSREPGVVILDARSREKFDELHIKGAVNLSFPDITVDSLAKMFPDKNATILIYCNNNFDNAPSAFPTKAPSASLNLSTYISLYTYGYRNIYELGPLLDAKTTKIELVETEKEGEIEGK